LGNKLRVEDNEVELNEKIEQELRRKPRIKRDIKKYEAIYKELRTNKMFGD